MSASLQSNPVDVLDFQPLPSPQRSLELPTDICFGSASLGGFLACVMTKHAITYAAQHPKTKHQIDVRSAHVQFYRPIFPSKDARVVMQLREISIGRAWSTFRVELMQGANARISASADVMVCDLDTPGKTLPTHWELSPPAHSVDLTKLETAGDPDWACYHTAFHPDGFLRAISYARYYFPRKIPAQIRFTEQWITPGWDCNPHGSRCREAKEARWTNDLIQFAIDIGLPIQENFSISSTSKPVIGSLAATLAFADKQKRARDEGISNWRDLNDDGSLAEGVSKLFKDSTVYTTLSMSTEIKKKLPVEGVRWLYLRTEAKKLEGSRMDLEVLVFDETMSLVAIGHQVAWVVSAVQKTQRGASL